MGKPSLELLRHPGLACIYVRLSRDDDIDGESYSISNQKKLLTKMAKEYGYKNIKVFCDDGISGVTMNRPEFNGMIKLIQTGKVAAVFVKDLSRLGRNYIEVGRLLEDFFPEDGVRFISISDSIDSDEGDNDLTPIRNLFNEWYSRDISKKRRISNKIRGSSGVPLGFPPYGYLKIPEDKYHWKIDKEAAPIVRRIFILTRQGLGPCQIADLFTEEKILTPIEYLRSKGIRKPSNKKNPDPYRWSSSTIIKILSMVEYCGDIVNFKSYSISYKKKKRIPNKPEDMMIFRDVNPAIIGREFFEDVQRIREQRSSKIRNKQTQTGERNIFSGLLVCADCGKTLNYHFNQTNPEIRYFNCPNYNKGKFKECTSTHYIRVDFLEEVVLGEIRRLTRFASRYEDKFTEMCAEFSKKALLMYKEANEVELKSLLSRDKELDRLFETIYEDNVSGKISDDRFRKLALKYETEQKEIEGKILRIQNKIDEFECRIISTDGFVSLVKKYTRVKKLTPEMLNELVEKIEVFQAEKEDGIKVQHIKIYYKCIGSVNIPEAVPALNISMKMRKGVVLNYVSSAE